MGLVQNMVALSPRELCVEVIEGSNFRSVWPAAERMVEDKVLCPMPRRIDTVSFITGECAKPFRQQWRSVPPPSTLECEANLELMEILQSQNSSINPLNFGRSPPIFSMSPPCRAGNPMVHDTKFVLQRQTTLPGAFMHAKLNVQQDAPFSGKRLGLPASAITQMKLNAPVPVYRASPHVRVEGFECPGRGFECASRGTRHHVSVVA